MIGRIAWLTLLIAVAIVIVGLQLDMASRNAPALSRLVPDALRNNAQVQIARQALAGGDGARALDEAETLVRRRPGPAEHLVLLAAGQIKAGKPEAALATIQIAARRGWRDPAAQEAMLRLALSAGDRPEAARRYAALFLRERTPDALLSELGPAVLEGPDDAGRRTLAAIVVGGERWHPLFLQRAPRVMPPAAFSAVAAMSLQAGANFDCGALGRSVKALARRDARAASELASIAAKRCPQLAPDGAASL